MAGDDFEMQHRSRTRHTNADTLSRRISTINAPDSAPSSDEEQRIDWGWGGVESAQKQDTYGLVEDGLPPPPPEELTLQVKTLCGQINKLCLNDQGVLCTK